MMSGTIIRKAAAAGPAGGGHKLGAALRAVLAWLWRYRQMNRERGQLLALTERELRDVGISRVDAVREARKPLWRG